MNFKSYLNLYEVLQNDSSTKESRRAFGLSTVLLQHKPYHQLAAWTAKYHPPLKKPSRYENISNYLYTVTFILVVLAFVLGLFAASALLQYNGQAPVNVVYFMAMVIALPLLTMMLTLFSMFAMTQSKSVLIHLSPAFWMEKILSVFPRKWHKNFENIPMNPRIANWLVIKRAQILTLSFSLGMLCALLAMVATQDIAFAWSTTLEIDAKTFHAFLKALSIPWSTWVPTAVPSLELITQSQYFRLGEKLSDTLISNASVLGGWWKFLAMATFFYAVILRFLFYMFVSLGFKRAVKKSMMELEGVCALLEDMNEPMITTQTIKQTISSLDDTAVYVKTLGTLDSSYDVIQSWAMSENTLSVLNDTLSVSSPLIFDVGGTHTLEEDQEMIHKSHGEVLLYVKAWEPPTMDFIDYLEALHTQVDKVIVYPIGTEAKRYKALDKHVHIWLRKLSLFHTRNVYVKKD